MTDLTRLHSVIRSRLQSVSHYTTHIYLLC